uniref:Uncharacterized protein n=1 Tax=Mycena chlorophos TaxID=658473 RepID=A0ABQ0M9D4_MYCCL|nr:predicted protein [Mycena chlorophos]
MLSSLLVLVPFIVGINAANDWSVPCTKGECSYDLAASNSTAAGSMRIYGSADAITDITTAAGWQILGCDPDALSQDIRLVCTNEDDPTSQCGHLYRNISAVNKLVRLPETCGGSAFARIANASDSDDQTLPDELQKRVMRRDGTIPTVKALTIDTNWHEVDYSQTGPVNIEITSSGDQASGVEARAAGAGTVTTGEAASGTIAQPGGSASGSLQKISGQAPVDGKISILEKAFKLSPFTANKKVNLINQSANCGAAGGKVSVDLAANTKAQASITVSAKGTVVPPKLTSFDLVSSVTANIGGIVTMDAGLSGKIDSGTITVLSHPVTGLDFPGVLTVGPVFRVTASVDGNVEVPVKMNAGINFVVNDAQLAFPASAGGKPSSSAFSVGDMPLTIDAEAGVKASGTVTAHMTPALLVGVNALNGKAVSQIDLSFDTNAALTMGLEASASGKASVNVKSAVASAVAAKKTPSAAETEAEEEEAACKRGTSGVKACAIKTKPKATTETAAKKPAAPAKKPVATTKKVSTSKKPKRAIATGTASGVASLSGCVKVNTGISVTGSATANFFDVFSKSTKLTLFTKTFTPFSKCFEATTAKKPAEPAAKKTRELRAYPRSTRLERTRRAALSCPAIKTAPVLSKITSETISKSSIH